MSYARKNRQQVCKNCEWGDNVGPDPFADVIEFGEVKADKRSALEDRFLCRGDMPKAILSAPSISLVDTRWPVVKGDDYCRHFEARREHE